MAEPGSTTEHRGRGGDPAAAVSMRDVVKTFGSTTVLDIPSLDLRPGGVTALIGPNGAGKSTCVKVIAGLWTPTSATHLSVLGVDRLARRGRRAPATDIGIVADSSQLYGTLTVRENLEYMARLYGVPRRDRGAAVGDALAACDLMPRADDRVWTLSTGLKQRANIARALVTRPRLLLLDEPTSGLDPVSVQQVYDALLRLRSSGLTMVICTHVMDEVDDLCDRVVFLKGGRIVADGSADDLRARAGSVVYALRVEDGAVDAARAALADHGLRRSAVRRTDEGTVLSVFGCDDVAVIDALGYDYARRRSELSDAFLVLAGE